jgi:hypothetical protein
VDMPSDLVSLCAGPRKLYATVAGLKSGGDVAKRGLRHLPSIPSKSPSPPPNSPVPAAKMEVNSRKDWWQ